MAHHRTKKQKAAQDARLISQQQTYALPTDFRKATVADHFSKVISSDNLSKFSQESMFGYSLDLVRKDLLKTAVLACIILSLLGLARVLVLA